MSDNRSSSSPVCLDDMKSSEQGRVCEIGACEHDCQRLLGMGVCLGRKLEVIKQGDPLIVRVYRTRIALSGHLAKQIFVEGVEQPA